MIAWAYVHSYYRINIPVTLFDTDTLADVFAADEVSGYKVEAPSEIE
jgi:hypothetical protein